jgi:hypothetical protein
MRAVNSAAAPALARLLLIGHSVIGVSPFPSELSFGRTDRQAAKASP